MNTLYTLYDFFYYSGVVEGVNWSPKNTESYAVLRWNIVEPILVVAYWAGLTNTIPISMIDPATFL